MRVSPSLLLLLSSLCCVSFWSEVTGFTSRTGRHEQLHQRPPMRMDGLLASPTTTSSSSSSSSSSSRSTAHDNKKKEETTAANGQFFKTAVPGPPMDTKPDYENIVGPLGRTMDRLFMTVFRRQLAKQVGQDSRQYPALDDYRGIMDLAAQMNRQFTNRTEIHARAQTVLRNLFPSWMPGSYAVLFSKPFPAFSSRMNAWATRVGGTWLMGECEINNVEVDDGSMGQHQGLLVKRCRFLEESGCASVCVNSCKIPTQQFFLQEMGLPLTMEPNYETFECQFSFGKTPNATTELVAQATPCLQRCPTAGSLRQLHQDSNCPLMEEPAAASSSSSLQQL